MDCVIVVAWERMVPRPMPGKTYMLLPAEIDLVCMVGYYWSRKTLLSIKGLRTLSRGQDFAVVIEVIEGATAGKKAFSIGVLNGVFECAFGFG